MGRANSACAASRAGEDGESNDEGESKDDEDKSREEGFVRGGIVSCGSDKGKEGVRLCGGDVEKSVFEEVSFDRSGAAIRGKKSGVSNAMDSIARASVVRGKKETDVLAELADWVVVRPSGFASGRSLPAGKSFIGGNFSGFEGRSFRSWVTVFMNNIPPSASASRLKVWFSNFGSVADVFTPQKRCKFRGLCFAFIRFRLESDALQACEKADGSTLDGYVLVVNISRYPRLVLNNRSDCLIKHSLYGGLLRRQRQGEILDADLGARISIGVKSAGNVDKVNPIASLRTGSGCSYAQVLLSSGVSKDVRHGNGPRGPVADRVVGKFEPCAENTDHLLAVMSNRLGMGVDPIRPRLFCVSDLLADMFDSSRMVAVRGSCPLSAGFLGTFEDDPVATVICSKGDKLGWGPDLCLTSDRLSDYCLLIEADGVESGISSVCDQGRISNAEVLVMHSPSSILSTILSDVGEDDGGGSNISSKELEIQKNSNVSVYLESRAAKVSHPVVVNGSVFELVKIPSYGVASTSSSAVYPSTASCEVSSPATLHKVPMAGVSKSSFTKEKVRSYSKFSARIVSTTIKVCKEAVIVISDRDERIISRLSVAELLQRNRMVLS